MILVDISQRISIPFIRHGPENVRVARTMRIYEDVMAVGDQNIWGMQRQYHLIQPVLRSH